MPTVVLHVLFAMTAFWNGNPHVVTIEVSRNTFSEIKQSIMRRVQFFTTWERALHRNRYPVAEQHASSFEVRSDMKRPLRKLVNEYRPTGLYNADAFINPAETPLEVIAGCEIIATRSLAIVLC